MVFTRNAFDVFQLVVSAWLDKVKLKHRINIGSSAKQTAPDGSIPGSAVVVTPPTTDAAKSVVTFDAEGDIYYITYLSEILGNLNFVTNVS